MFLVNELVKNMIEGKKDKFKDAQKFLGKLVKEDVSSMKMTIRKSFF
ncbi:MAG: hypothetical protein HFJ08_11900 [Lachnospiraceae bacterium]|nr:hypothetical protein [Lachnospiraceae bacterium]